MANLISPLFKQALWEQPSGSSLVSGTVKVVGVDLADYTYSSAHDFYDDVPGASRIGTPQTIGSKTFTNGVFDGADVTFPSVTGDQFEALVIYIDTGVESTSRLVAYLDTVGGFPRTPGGGDSPAGRAAAGR